MNGFGAIAFGVGLQDGLNPCVFMTCAIFMIHGLWVKPGFWRVISFRIIFVLVYALCALLFNFSPAQLFVFQKYFLLFARFLYLVLGAGVFVLAILFIRDWFLLSRGLPAKDLVEKKLKLYEGKGWGALLTTVLLAVVLSAIACLWPINTYLMVLGNEAIVRGQWHLVIYILLRYIFFAMWPIWLAWAFISIKNLRPSTLKIFYSLIFFTASMTMIFIFK